MIKRFKFDSRHSSFIILNRNYFFDCIPDIKLCNYFSEFASIDLSEIKEVINQEAHHVGGGILDGITLLNHPYDLFNLLINLFNCLILVFIHNAIQFF